MIKNKISREIYSWIFFSLYSTRSICFYPIAIWYHGLKCTFIDLSHVSYRTIVHRICDDHMYRRCRYCLTSMRKSMWLKHHPGYLPERISETLQSEDFSNRWYLMCRYCIFMFIKLISSRYFHRLSWLHLREHPLTRILPEITWVLCRHRKVYAHEQYIVLWSKYSILWQYHPEFALLKICLDICLVQAITRDTW